MLENARGEILVARRFDHAHQGGLWEFPGGKVEPSEKARDALARELAEELGIAVDAARPLIRVRHDYPDRRVLLDVWRVTAWQGTVRGHEGQELGWIAPDALVGLDMPAADAPIVTAIRLPDRYLVTPPPGADETAFLAMLAASVEAGVCLVGLRAKGLPEARLVSLARRAVAVCRPRGARLLVNAGAGLLAEIDVDGIHLDRARLVASSTRPVPGDVLLAASCHDARELRHAERIGVDFAMLSPVAATASHPGAPALGWSRFRELVDEVNVPVYALGGMTPSDLETAWEHGAQGIAGIRALWGGSHSRG